MAQVATLLFSIFVALGVTRHHPSNLPRQGSQKIWKNNNLPRPVLDLAHKESSLIVELLTDQGSVRFPNLTRQKSYRGGHAGNFSWTGPSPKGENLTDL